MMEGELRVPISGLRQPVRWFSGNDVAVTGAEGTSSSMTVVVHSSQCLARLFA